jgi:hypothetical protein
MLIPAIVVAHPLLTLNLWLPSGGLQDKEIGNEALEFAATAALVYPILSLAPNTPSSL